MPNDYRADQVGSFLRPPQVLQAHAAHAEGRLSLEQLRRVEDEAVLALLELQRQSGIDVYSDGEYRRASWSGDFAESVQGYVAGSAPVTVQFHPGPATPQSIATATPVRAGGGRVIGEKLRQTRRLALHESGFLQQHSPGPYKITLPAPSYLVARAYNPEVTGKVYASRKDVLQDVAAIIRAEVQALAQEGTPYIQLDNPHYPDYVDATRREQYLAMGIDPEQALLDDIDADNSALAGVDRSRVTLGMHLCRGNGAGGGWHTSGGYDAIAEQLFSRLEVDRFLLEYDTDRAGGFEPLRFVPRGRTVVLGLLTTKTGVLESKDELKRRIDAASRYVPLSELALSPQCGFASVSAGNPLSWDEQRQKLELVVETAHEVWR